MEMLRPGAKLRHSSASGIGEWMWIAPPRRRRTASLPRIAFGIPAGASGATGIQLAHHQVLLGCGSRRAKLASRTTRLARYVHLPQWSRTRDGLPRKDKAEWEEPREQEAGTAL